MVSACPCFVPIFIILSRSSNKVPFRTMGHIMKKKINTMPILNHPLFSLFVQVTIYFFTRKAKMSASKSLTLGQPDVARGRSEKAQSQWGHRPSGAQKRQKLLVMVSQQRFGPWYVSLCIC